MKKLVFGLIATVIIGFSGNAQEYKNKSNPFDGRGEIHNQILKDFVAKRLASDLEVDAVVNEITKIIKGNSSYLNAIGSENLTFDASFVDQAASDYSKKYKTMIGNSSLSAEGKAKASELVNLTFDESVTFDSFITKVKALETKIIGSSMNAEEKEILFTSTSVARHSAYLWIVNQNIDRKASSDGGSPKARKGRGWIVVGADILGGCVGGFAGAAYGSGCAYYITGGFKD